MVLSRENRAHIVFQNFLITISLFSFLKLYINKKVSEKIKVLPQHFRKPPFLSQSYNTIFVVVLTHRELLHILMISQLLSASHLLSPKQLYSLLRF